MYNLSFFLVAFGLILILYYLYNRWTVRRLIAESFESIGTVIDYETRRERHDFMDYPVVKYKDNHGKWQIGWVKYAKSPGRVFHIGKEIPIVVHDTNIYYKNTLNSPVGRIMGIAFIIVGLIYELFFTYIQ